VSRFLEHASEIFDAATAAEEPAALTILIHPSGQIRIVDGAERPLDSLQLEHGARTAYRVTRDSGRVRVEGRGVARRCLLESEPSRKLAAAKSLGLLVDRPVYSIAG